MLLGQLLFFKLDWVMDLSLSVFDKSSYCWKGMWYIMKQSHLWLLNVIREPWIMILYTFTKWIYFLWYYDSEWEGRQNIPVQVHGLQLEKTVFHWRDHFAIVAFKRSYGFLESLKALVEDFTTVQIIKTNHNVHFLNGLIFKVTRTTVVRWRWN